MRRHAAGDLAANAPTRERAASLLSVAVFACGVGIYYKRYLAHSRAPAKTRAAPLRHKPVQTTSRSRHSPAHLRSEGHRPRRGLLAGAAGLLLLSGGAAILVLETHGAFDMGTPAAASSASTSTSMPRTPSTAAPAAGWRPLSVLLVRPRPGATAVAFSSAITVKFSVPLAAHTADPTLSPNVPGTWAREGSRTLVFHPRGFLLPLSRLVLTVPAGPSGPSGVLGQSLPKPYSSSFTVAGVSVLRLQQLLAELNYLPVQFDSPPAPTDEPSESLTRSLTPGVPRWAVAATGRTSQGRE
ncbi:MAG TPA: Ig-like domain-containing protein, partial [Acidimicrobiales bacterium]|nr:Ig-like domain-containing protein [Acidimicrobiales bacterium]